VEVQRPCTPQIVAKILDLWCRIYGNKVVTNNMHNLTLQFVRALMVQGRNNKISWMEYATSSKQLRDKVQSMKQANKEKKVNLGLNIIGALQIQPP